MIALRSLVFSVLAGVWTIVMTIVLLPILLLPAATMRRVAPWWGRGLLALARVVCGLDYRVVGGEHRPTGPAIIAAKHQSAWDTLVFHLLLPRPVYILKRELLAVPFMGWYLRRTGNIGIDRAAGFRALKGMLRPVDEALAEGAQVIIFPEGTRVAPDERRPYQPGVAALYAHAGLPVTPVALNSGLFWGRRSFLKFPGVITLEFLPPIAPGLPRGAFLARLEHDIETAVARLVAEGQGETAVGSAPTAAPRETAASPSTDASASPSAEESAGPAPSAIRRP